jgi:uncharacterized protein (TIGR02145 family)
MINYNVMGRICILLILLSSCQFKHNIRKTVDFTTVIDIDGNVYNVVMIGNQKWMKENLKVSHFRNGLVITEVEDPLKWGAGDSTISAWCYFCGIDTNNPTYGKLYNWYAVMDSNQLCPVGYHVPSDSEWHVLALTLDSSATLNNDNEIESKYAGGE